MPYWAMRDDYYYWPWEFLASVEVRNKIYICTTERFSEDHQDLYVKKISIRLLDLSTGNPERYVQNFTFVNFRGRVLWCVAVSKDEEIHLLFHCEGIAEANRFILLTYHTKSRLWSEHETNGPRWNNTVFTTACPIERTIFVYQLDQPKYPSEGSVHTFDIETKEWILRHIGPIPVHESLIRKVLPWKHYLVGIGRHIYPQQLGVIYQAVPPRNGWNVCMFDTTTNSWFHPPNSGQRPNDDQKMDYMTVYHNKLLAISRWKRGIDQASPTIYCCDLNNYVWSIVQYAGIPSNLPGLMTSCFCINHQIYCFKRLNTWRTNTIIEVLNMKVISLMKICLKEIRDGDRDVARDVTRE